MASYTDTSLSKLVINKLPSQEVYNTLAAEGKINDNELYFIEGEGTSQLRVDNGYLQYSLDGITWANIVAVSNITSNELGYLSGATNNIQEQLDGKLSSSAQFVASVDGSYGIIVTNGVKYTTQELTEEQKAQARTNIGAGTSNFDGNYNSLTNIPSIPSTTSSLTNDSGFITNADVQKIYSGSADPDNSVGNDGDWYFQYTTE